MADFGSGYRYHVTGLFHDPMGYPTSAWTRSTPGSSASTVRWNAI